MYSWRGRLGVIYPTPRGRTIKDWYSIIPDGVGIYPGVIGFKRAQKEEFESGIAKAEQIAEDLVNFWKVQAIVIEGLPPFAIKGLEFETKWAAAMEEKLKVPFITPLKSHAECLKILGIKKPVVLTYFGEELNSFVEDSLESAGLDGSRVSSYHRFRNKGEAMYSTSLIDLDQVQGPDVYRFAREVFEEAKGDADGVYIVGSGWEYLSVIESLEADLRTSVLGPTCAYVFTALSRLGISASVRGRGKLLSMLCD